MGIVSAQGLYDVADPDYDSESGENSGAYHLEFSSSIRQLVGLGGLFCQLNVQNKKAWLQGSKPAKMLCMGHREFGTNR